MRKQSDDDGSGGGNDGAPTKPRNNKREMYMCEQSAHNDSFEWIVKINSTLCFA